MGTNDDALGYTRELIARYRAGDQAALEQLMRRYYPRIQRIVRIRVGPALLARAEVGDYVADVMERMLRSFDTYQPRADAEFIDWVTTVAENTIRRQARHMHAKKRGGDVAERVRQIADSIHEVEARADTTSVPDKVARAELIERVDDCVARLSDAHREVILLRLYKGFEWRVVAAKMRRTSAEACEELYRRARNELLERMIETYPDEADRLLEPGSGVFDW